MTKSLRLNINGKLMLIMLLLSLLPLIILGIASYRNARQTLEENIGHKLGEFARLAIERVDQQLNTHFKEVHIWAGLEVMQDVLTDDADIRIMTTLSDLMKGYKNYLQLYCLNRNGEIIASGNPQNMGKIMAGKDWFKKAIIGRTYISDVIWLESGKKMGILFAVPIRSFGSREVIGVLSAALDWESIYPIVESIKVDAKAGENSLSAHVMLINKSGTVIFAPEFEREAILKERIFSLEGLTDELELGKAAGYTISVDEHNRNSLIGYAISKGFGGYAGKGWTALALQNVAQAFAPITALKNFIFISTIILIIVILVVATLFTRRLTNPIKLLTAIMTKVASQGDLTQKVSIKSGDEIGQMASSFNQMTETLAETAAAAERISNQDLTVDIKPRSSKDMLGNAFIKMLTNLREMVGRIGC